MIQVKEDDIVRTVARKGEKRNTYNSVLVKPDGKSPVKYVQIHGMTIVKLILEKEDRVVLIGLVWLRIESTDDLF
jgi:hypothetical protein